MAGSVEYEKLITAGALLGVIGESGAIPERSRHCNRLPAQVL